MKEETGSRAFVWAAGHGDLPAIAAIYAPYVERTVITFETEPPGGAAWAARFDAVAERGLPFLVAESEGDVVGYAYAGQWKERAAYRHTVEDAIYLAPGSTGRGVGRVLLGALLQACAAAGVQQVVAVIADSGDRPRPGCTRGAGSARSGGWSGSGSSTASGSTRC